MSQTGVKRKRVTAKARCPNPLFEQWLWEWQVLAQANGSKMQHCFATALNSLRLYPVPLVSAKDCKILKGFGDLICEKLDRKLLDHIRGADFTSPNIIPMDTDPATPEPTAGPSSPSRQYIPKKSSGAYAIILTLFEKSLQPNYAGYLTKVEIVRDAQLICYVSFTVPEPNTKCTAWSEMTALVSKSLVSLTGDPTRFSLTPEGVELGRMLYEKNNATNNNETENVPSTSNGATNIISPPEEVRPNYMGLDKTFLDDLDMRQLSVEILEYLPSTDSAVPSTDSALPSTDSALPSTDSAVPSTDSAVPSTDSALPSNDSASIDSAVPSNDSASIDSAVPSNDSASIDSAVPSNDSASIDSAVPSTDSAVPSNDSALPSNDSGAVGLRHFEIILYVDNQETLGKHMAISDDPLLAELSRRGARYEVKHLKVGDFAWIARDRDSPTELMLPFIVERKRMDDLASSIKDGRYQEQKFRLKRCGVPNVIYLIESYGKNDKHIGLPMSSLYQAATNTAIQDGFSVVTSENTKETVDYLANFTELMTNQFKGKGLICCPKDDLGKIDLTQDTVSLMTFTEFSVISAKNKDLTVSDMFVRLLIQINGMSVEKAMAIVQKYTSPKNLAEAFTIRRSRNDQLLAPIVYGKANKKIGMALSKAVFQLFTEKQF